MEDIKNKIKEMSSFFSLLEDTCDIILFIYTNNFKCTQMCDYIDIDIRENSIEIEYANYEEGRIKLNINMIKSIECNEDIVNISFKNGDKLKFTII